MAKLTPQSAGGNQLTGTNTRVNAITSVMGLKGFDQQTILTSSAANDLTGTFNVAIDGKSTGPLAHDITAENMKKAFENLGHLGSIRVFRENVGNGFRWTLIFLTKLGTVAPLTCDASLLLGTGTPTCTTQQTVPGTLPVFDSNLASYAEINVTSTQKQVFIYHKWFEQCCFVSCSCFGVEWCWRFVRLDSILYTSNIITSNATRKTTSRHVERYI